MSPTAAGAFAPRTRYRCRKGHVTENKVTHWFGDRGVACCPHCWLDLMERECGGLEELPAESQRKKCPECRDGMTAHGLEDVLEQEKAEGALTLSGSWSACERCGGTGHIP